MDRHGRARPRDDEGREERACCVLLAKGTAAWERRHPCLHTPLTARAGPAIRNAAWKAALPGVRAHGSGRATGIAAPSPTPSLRGGRHGLQEADVAIHGEAPRGTCAWIAPMDRGGLRPRDDEGGGSACGGLNAPPADPVTGHRSPVSGLRSLA